MSLCLGGGLVWLATCKKKYLSMPRKLGMFPSIATIDFKNLNGQIYLIKHGLLTFLEWGLDL